jgi:immunity protein 52 of polymorphic toxin system
MTSFYSVLAYWGPRRESPEVCARKLLEMFETLANIDPALGQWFWRDRTSGKPLPVAALDTQNAARLLKQRQNLGEVTRKPIPEFGYRFVVTNELPWGPRCLTLDGQLAGYTRAGMLANYVSLSTQPLHPENQAIINFRVFRQVLLELARIWAATWCRAASSDLFELLPTVDTRRRTPRISGGWMTYLAAPFAAKIALPHSGICEQVDGGLLMSATQETFSVDNPAHVAVARDIDAALAPINALPWPPDGTSESISAKKG